MQRTKMIWMCSLALLSLLTPSMVRADIDPEAEYAAIIARFQAANKEAMKQRPPDLTAIQNVQQEINLRVLADLKDVDPTMIDPAKGLGWAQLFSLSGESQKMILAAQLFLNTNPDPSRKFTAQMLILQACMRSGDAVGIVKIVPTITSLTAAQTVQLAHLLLDPTTIDTIAEKQGAPAALAFVKQVEATIPFDQLKTPQELMSKDMLIFKLADARADLFSAEGKQAEALAVLEEAKKRVSPGSYYTVAPELPNKITITKLINSPAPPLKRERGYGAFTGLDAYKGKVVLLNFSEPTVSPCKEILPALKKIYVDLHDKGFEIVNVTSLLSPFAKRPTTPDAEFAKMKDFIAQFEITWPVIFVEEANQQSYGPNVIPRCILIDQTGKVVLFTIGPGTWTMNKVRRTVENLLSK